MAALPPGQWGYQAEDGQQRAGFRDGDQFAAGRERGGSGVEPGAGAAAEGNRVPAPPARPRGLWPVREIRPGPK